MRTTLQARSNGTSGTSAASFGGLYNKKYSSYLNDEPMPDAASEKEQVGTSVDSLPFLLQLEAVVETSFGEAKPFVSCVLFPGK